MIILLDEDFPLRFYTRLQREGFPVEHILLTRRGIHDREILVRLKDEELLFLTQDQDFVDAAPTVKQVSSGRESRNRWQLIDGSKSGLKR